jgi:hypothetical protein
MHDFSNTLIRCSSLGDILCEPQSKEAKLAGELSKSAKTALIRTYIKEVYDREKEITTKQMEKGTTAEEQGITLLSRYLKKFLTKNQERYSNDFVTGHPDIIDEDTVYDTKLSWDLWSFLPNVTEPLDKGYMYQLQGYMWLTGKPKGAIAYVLTDCPQEIITQEKMWLLKRMNVVSEASPEYIEAAAGLEINLIYPDIPLNERVLIIPVERDEEILEKIKVKVKKCRLFLEEFAEKHKNFNKLHLYNGMSTDRVL